MTEKDFYKVKDIVSEIEKVKDIASEIENLKRRKQIALDAVRRHFWWDDDVEHSFPSVCKQPMTDILCAYYNREIAMAQAKLNAIEIRFGKTDDNSKTANGGLCVHTEYPDPRLPKETGPMTANTDSQSDTGV